VVREQYEAIDLEKELDDWVRDQCRDLYRTLQEEYEDLTSEAQFIERCVDDGTLFDVEVDDEDEEVESAANESAGV